jgi:hypothetical protein
MTEEEVTSARADNEGSPEQIGETYGALYKLAGVAVLLMLLLMVLSIAGYLRWPVAAGTTPTEEIYALTQTNIWAAFIALDLGVSVSSVLSCLVLAALYGVLRSRSEGLALVALILGLVSVAAMVSARGVLEVFTLADQHAFAQGPEEELRLLAAGDAILAQFHGAAWHISILLGAVSYAISSWLMRESPYFGMRTATVGLATNLAACLFWIPSLGTAMLFLSMLGWMLWAPMLAVAFFRTGRPPE